MFKKIMRSRRHQKRRLAYMLVFLFLISCGQPISRKENESGTAATPDTVERQLQSEWTESYDRQNRSDLTDYESEDLSGEFDNVVLYQLTDSIIADFNGDGIVDRAIFEKDTKTSGITITHGNTNEDCRIGFGAPFAHMTEFNWVDFWGLVNDEETYEIVIEDDEVVGGRQVELQNPAIVLRKAEVGGGLITFLDGKYVWIHQAD